MKRALTFLILLAIVVGGGFWAYTVLRSDNTDNANQTITDKPDSKADSQPDIDNQSPQPAAPQTFTFEQPKKAAHYVSSTPVHEAVLDSAPAEISIAFNFDLSPESTISVIKDGRDVSTGTATIGANKLTLKKAIGAGTGSGLYTVQYNACWPDGSCHDGQFQFGVK